MSSTHAVALLALLAGSACAGAQVEGAGGSGGASGGGGPQGSGGGGGGGVAIDLDAAVARPDLRKADLPPDSKPYRCDDAGNCNICLAILSLGQPGSFGAGSGSADNTNAFQDFMNNNTMGTARMVMQKTFTPLSDQLLNQYDVVILQYMGENVYSDYGIWKFQQSDADALKRWVTEKGGAVIAMSGYNSGIDGEVGPLNQLMAPFGISYDTDDLFNDGDCPEANTCYCSYGSIPFDNWSIASDTAGITTNPDGTPLGKIAMFMGRSIKCTGADCNVFAKHPKNGATVGVGKLVGQGRVFALADEWVTYTSQWGLAPDTSSTGYDDFGKNPQCEGHTPNSSYSVGQFWYNVFRWSVPSAGCFIIEQPEDPGQGIIY